jgi:hypothetical protein
VLGALDDRADLDDAEDLGDQDADRRRLLEDWDLVGDDAADDVPQHLDAALGVARQAAQRLFDAVDEMILGVVTGRFHVRRFHVITL